MLKIQYHTKFKKDYKRIRKRGYDIAKLEKVILLLANNQELPPEYKDHALTGNFASFRECHITPDWLLIYTIQEQELILVLSRTGTHSDLF